MHEIPLTEAEAGQRLDRYLRKLLRAMPLGAIHRHLREGHILLDGQRAAGNVRLLAGMTMQLHLPDADIAAVVAMPHRRSEPAPRGPARPWTGPVPRILFRDAHLLVVSKPAGLAVQPGTGQQENVVAWLDRQRLGLRTATFAPAPAHRLDRGTSGLVAIGLSPEGLRGLTAAFRDDRVEKVYLAVVHGVPARERGSIVAPLWQDEHADSRQAKVRVDERGQSARTDYEVLQRGRHLALLRLVLHTGRRHQIRAHLQHLGHPIAGDRRYGSVAEVGGGFLLHAAELRFLHPHSGVPLQFVDPPPEQFARHFAPE